MIRYFTSDAAAYLERGGDEEDGYTSLDELLEEEQACVGGLNAVELGAQPQSNLENGYNDSLQDELDEFVAREEEASRVVASEDHPTTVEEMNKEEELEELVAPQEGVSGIVPPEGPPTTSNFDVEEQTEDNVEHRTNKTLEEELEELIAHGQEEEASRVDATEGTDPTTPRGKRGREETVERLSPSSRSPGTKRTA